MKELAKDQRGGVMLIGLFMALSLIGAVWFIIGIGNAVVFRDRMQEAADAVAFSSAAVHARGMNMIAALNLVLFALVGLYLLMTFVDLLMVTINDALLTCDATVVGSPICSAPLAAEAPAHRIFHRIWSGYCRLAAKVMPAVSTAQSVVAIGAPWAGAVAARGVAADYDQSGLAIGPSMVPGSLLTGSPLGGAPYKTPKGKFSLKGIDARLGLPVVNQELREECGHESRMVVEYVFHLLDEIPVVGGIINLGIPGTGLKIGKIIENAIEEVVAQTFMYSMCPSVLHDPLELATGNVDGPKPPIGEGDDALEAAAGKAFPQLPAGHTPPALPPGKATPPALPPGKATPPALPPGKATPPALPPAPPTPPALPPGNTLNFLIDTSLFFQAADPAQIAKLQDRIEKLRAKAESSTFPEEKSTFNNAADALQKKLDALKATAPKPPPTEPKPPPEETKPPPKELPPGKTPPKELPPGAEDEELPPVAPVLNASGWINWDGPGPKKTFIPAYNGSDWMQVWGYLGRACVGPLCIGSKPGFTETNTGSGSDTSENKLTLSQTGGAGGLAPTNPETPDAYTAEAEFYFDCGDAWNGYDCNGENYWFLSRSMYSMRWRARLRRVRPPDVAGLVMGELGGMLMSENVRRWLIKPIKASPMKGGEARSAAEVREAEKRINSGVNAAINTGIGVGSTLGPKQSPNSPGSFH